MEGNFHHSFLGIEELDDHYSNGNLENMSLDRELFDGLGVEPYQSTAHGGLLSPNSSIHDLPGSGQESPFLPSLSPIIGDFGFQQSDGSSDAYDDHVLRAMLLQQLQESHTNAGLATYHNHLSTNSNSTARTSSKSDSPQAELTMTSSGYTNMEQHPSFMTPWEGSHCVPFQNSTVTTPSECYAEQSAPQGTPELTHVPNNTSSISVLSCLPLDCLPHSPKSKPQHFIQQQSSHLQNPIHPQQSQYSPHTATVTETNITSQLPHNMPTNSKFINGQEPNPFSSYNIKNLQSIHHSSSKPQFRRIISGQNQTRGTPVLPNYQPFQESNLRSSVTPNSGQDFWEAEQFQISQYPDPQQVFQQQSNTSPHMGHHHVSGHQVNDMKSFSPEQYHMQLNHSQNASFINQDVTNFGFDWSSPANIKHELTSSDSDHAVSKPAISSQMPSPRPQKKRRGKQQVQKRDEKTELINPVALQTADMTDLDPIDQSNVTILINAMHNTASVEDNEGMRKTWEKVRIAKAFRIREVCVELLVSLESSVRFCGQGC